MRPDPAGPVSRTERPRPSSRTSRSRSSSRASSGGVGTAGPGRTGGRAAASRAMRSAAPRLAGAVPPVPGRRGSISLPSTGFTVRVKSPVVRVTIRATGAGAAGAGAPEVPDVAGTAAGRSIGSGCPCVRSMYWSPRSRSAPIAVVSYRPAFAHSAVATGPVSARTLDGARSCGEPQGCHHHRTVTFPQEAWTVDRVRPAGGIPLPGRPRSRGCGAVGWRRGGAASAAALRAGRGGGRSGRPAGGLP